MSDYTPVYTPGAAFTLTASAAITGGQVLEVSGNGTVAPAGANSVKVVGVAAHDAANGTRVTIHRIQGVVHEVTTTAGVTAGDTIGAAAAGTVATVVAATAAAGGFDLGTALTTVGAAGKARFLGL